MKGLKCLCLNFLCITIFTTNTVTGKSIILKMDEESSIRGTQMKSVSGRTFYAFRGIPYAEPPVADLRFKPPVSKVAWKVTKDVLDATKDGPVCPQIDFVFDKYSGQEDCLYLNVYTPNLSSESAKLPVAVYIHGGGFMSGSSDSSFYGPEKLMDAEIVLVMMNYRLGSLGFFSVGDDSAPGNYGLMDQAEALKWIQHHIDSFGGDPNQVTLIGQSSGSTSAAFHMTSDMSKGLFHQIILISGTSLCPWSNANDSTYWARRLAEEYKCPTDKTVDLVECVRSISAQKLIDTSVQFSKEGGIPFGPTVDGKFVSDKAEKLLATKKIVNRVPVMMGITQEEGSCFFLMTNRKLAKFSQELFDKNVRICLNNRNAAVPEVENLLKEHYFSKTDLTNEMEFSKSSMKMLSDGMLKIWHYEAMRYLLEAGINIYAFSYDYESEYGIRTFFGIKEHIGTGHGEEISVMFDLKPMNFLPVSKRTKTFSKMLVSLLTNFIIFGNPTPKTDPELINWPLTTDPDKVLLYHLDESPSVTILNPNENPNRELWLHDIPQALTFSVEDKNNV